MHDRHGRTAPADTPVRALARLSDFDALPGAALVSATDIKVLLGGLKDDAITQLIRRGVLPRPIRLVAAGASPRLWTADEVRVALAALAAKRRAA
jgi:hypothetical protein